MFNPDQSEERKSYFLALDNLTHLLKETIRLLNVKWTRNKLLNFSFQDRILMVYAPHNYIKIIQCRIENSILKLDLMSYHDSEWTYGIERFLDKLFSDYNLIAGFEHTNVSSFDFTIRSMSIVDMDNLSEELKNAIRDLDYDRNEKRTKHKEMTYNDQNDGRYLFPLLTQEMRRIEKQEEK